MNARSLYEVLRLTNLSTRNWPVILHDATRLHKSFVKHLTKLRVTADVLLLILFEDCKSRVTIKTQTLNIKIYWSIARFRGGAQKHMEVQCLAQSHLSSAQKFQFNWNLSSSQSGYYTPNCGPCWTWTSHLNQPYRLTRDLKQMWNPQRSKAGGGRVRTSTIITRPWLLTKAEPCHSAPIRHWPRY